MSAPADTKVQINFKGNEPPLVNVYAASSEQLQAILQNTDWALIGAAAADYMAGFRLGSGLGAETVTVTASRPVPQQQAAPATAGGSQCPHGTRVAKSGVNKNTGKPWAGLFCPVDDKACKPEWTSTR